MEQEVERRFREIEAILASVAASQAAAAERANRADARMDRAEAGVRSNWKPASKSVCAASKNWSKSA